MNRLVRFPVKAGNSSQVARIAEMYERLRADVNRRHVEHLLNDLLRIEERQAREGRRRGPQGEDQ